MAMTHTMKWLNTMAVLAAAGLLVSCATPKQDTGAGAEVLFNGKDLSGWKSVSKDPSVPQEKVWSVRDGIIVCQGEPMGFICTEKSYTNFKLHVEYRWAPGQKPGNSGIFTRINGAPKPLPRCIETQLKHGNAGDLYGFQGFPINGEETRFKKVLNHEIGGDFCGVSRLAGAEAKPGQWNRVDIQVEGPRITVQMNGRKVNEATDAEIIAGPIGLQSEGGEIHFRNVRLTPLP